MMSKFFALTETKINYQNSANSEVILIMRGRGYDTLTHHQKGKCSSKAKIPIAIKQQQLCF